ncbi:MAG: phage shock protein operon transcriptional activator [Sphaerochaetaceae bacterium]|nr:phage shock protein operon transcriptional activator [Sphaerochaetaceae bacterium]
MYQIEKPLGESDIFLKFQQRLSKAARVNRSVLVIGERGSGKELAAQRLHYLSPRWEKALVTVNCAALPPSLIETELFGHESGAFTGAQKTRKGRFEEAEGGTLFLDEIGLIPLEVQEKILRVVEYGTFERVGSSKSHKVDVRIIGATNLDLIKLCAEGKFKEDLLDRLSFEVLFLPPLRTRGDDILLLANYFASKMSLECQIEEMPEFSDEVIEHLKNYSWPGNVRELKNVIERAVYRSESSLITEIDLNPFKNPYSKLQEKKSEQEKVEDTVTTEVEPSKNIISEKLVLKDYLLNRQNFDLQYLKQALVESNNNQREAAKLLGLSYDQLRGLYRKFKHLL